MIGSQAPTHREAEEGPSKRFGKAIRVVQLSVHNPSAQVACRSCSGWCRRVLAVSGSSFPSYSQGQGVLPTATVA
jgi:hypothetical protein